MHIIIQCKKPASIYLVRQEAFYVHKCFRVVQLGFQVYFNCNLSPSLFSSEPCAGTVYSRYIICQRNPVCQFRGHKAFRTELFPILKSVPAFR